MMYLFRIEGKSTMLQTILTVSADDEDDEIYDAIGEILSRGMPNVQRARAWLEFVINRLASKQRSTTSTLEN